ncbi:MAG TPA: hypothetical protein HA224_02410 [Nanoarchaeota archaeon]|nr:hypothetical protein [Nanoarchaeota archaeon]
MAIDYEKILKLGSKGRLVETKDSLKIVEQKQLAGLQFMGLEQLRPFEYEFAKSRFEDAFAKMSKRIEILYFLVQIKLYEIKDRGKTKYSIHIRVAVPGKHVNIDNDTFDINSAVNGAINSLEQNLSKFAGKLRDQQKNFGKGRKKVMRDTDIDIFRAEKMANKRAKR